MTLMSVQQMEFKETDTSTRANQCNAVDVF